MRMTAATYLALTICLVTPFTVRAQDTDLTRLRLEDLLQMEVTSVARKAQSLARTAAAVHVITQEDIRRSGAQTIPDLLRMVPGFTVAQIDANSWAISARGFAGLYANKLLVLVDGRSVYTPLFGGVHWDMQNIPMSDVDRIEVIRGPGGTLWGANAMNGVINVITKPASATKGTAVVAELGGQQRGDVQARTGGGLGDWGHYRAYGRHFRRGSAAVLEGFADPDLGEVTLGGARLDWAPGSEHRLSLHGSIQEGSVDKIRKRTTVSPYSSRVIRERSEYIDANVAFSWTHSSSPRAEYGLQTYYQHYERRGSALVDRWHTIDVDARHRRALGARHEVVAGGGLRWWANDLTQGLSFQVFPAAERMHTVSAFAQDEIELVKDRLRATVGTKFEHNALSDAGFQPSIRATWTPHEEHAFWAAASRSIRTPSRAELGMTIPVAVTPGPRGLPMVITLEGNPDLRPELLHASEVGYRMQRRSVSIDVTAFANDYHHLQTTERGQMTTGYGDVTAIWRLPLVSQNLMDGSASGAELSAMWRIADWWKISGAYSRLWLNLTPLPASRDTDSAAAAEGSAPRYSAHARTYLDLPWNIEASVLGYRVDGLPAQSIPAYTRVDARLGWTWRGVEIAGGVHNLGHRDQSEFTEEAGVRSIDVSTRLFAQVGVRF